MFHKNVPKVKKVQEPLPAKRTRREPTNRDYVKTTPKPVVNDDSASNNSDLGDSSDSGRDQPLPAKKQIQQRGAPRKGATEPSVTTTSLQVEGNLEDHVPMKVRSLHGIKQSKEWPETMCTVEWKRDLEKGIVPKDSSVSYADMRRQYPLLLCDFF